MERWILYALLSMLFAGVTSVIAKFGLRDMSSEVGLAVRTSVVFCIVLLHAALAGNLQEVSTIATTNPMAIVYLCISGITTSLSWIFYYHAIRHGHVSIVASIDKASIVVVLLLSFLILKEPITPKILLGCGLIVAGVGVLIWK
ncbi:MAG: EamA family transporter [Bacteroidota bacterium]|nr:EamA family transporter [Candidatus Kapabacteria bacterium]MDW8219855.1 EamA family transporter [Bacteroidota bacterium]